MIIKKEELFPIVCNIIIPTPKGEFSGTGFFIQTKKTYYLVTATHVIKDSNAETYLLVNNSSKISLSDLKIPGKKWIHHSIADVSIIEIFNPGPIKLTFLDESRLIETIPQTIKQLTAIGFPFLSTAQRTPPLSFESNSVTSSLITLPRADHQEIKTDFICLNNPSMGGYSGCPIFDLDYLQNSFMMMTGTFTKCIGITHATISDSTGGKIAAITPIKYLIQLIRKNEENLSIVNYRIKFKA